MTANNTTTRYLLQGIVDPSNRSQWLAFDDRYRPIIEGFARRLGLNEHEASDVAQDTLLRFMKDFRLGKYDPTRGRLRSWLISIAKNRITDTKASQAKRGSW